MNNKGYEVLRKGFNRLGDGIRGFNRTLIHMIEGLAFNESLELEKKGVKVQNYNGCMYVYEQRETNPSTVFPTEFAEMNSRLYKNK